MFPHETTKSITFIVTNACNFACTYCYLPHKSDNEVMTLDVASKAIDFILSESELFFEDRAQWEFIGGEPLLEVNLIADIIYYILYRSYEANHRWFYNSSFGVTTNGYSYLTPDVQKLVRSLGNRFNVSITIDGVEEAHDACRKNRGGKGTYRAVRRAVDARLTQYPSTSTKVTFAHENLNRLSESIIHLFDIGFKTVNANVVFENVWETGDDEIFERELKKLGIIMLDRGYYRSHSCSLFNRDIGQPVPTKDDNNWCGTGKMLAIDWDGFYYPCNRFAPSSLKGSHARAIGHVDSGIDKNLLRPFLALTRTSQSSDKCLNCIIATGCAWCQGLNYDETGGKTIYKRATNICLMHQARVRANEWYWAKLDGVLSST